MVSGCEAVQDCCPDLEFGLLAVEVSCHDAFPEQLEAAHLCRDQTSSVISAPTPPDRAAKSAGGTNGIMPGLCAGSVLQPWPGILAGQYDDASAARRDGGLAGAGIISAVRTDLSNGLIGGDLVEQVG